MTTDSVESLRPMYMGQTASTHRRDALAYRLWASHVTLASPSPNSIIWHRSMGGDALQLGRLDFSGLTTYGLKAHEREISTPPKLHLEYDTLYLYRQRHNDVNRLSNVIIHGNAPTVSQDRDCRPIPCSLLPPRHSLLCTYCRMT